MPNEVKLGRWLDELAFGELILANLHWAKDHSIGGFQWKRIIRPHKNQGSDLPNHGWPKDVETTSICLMDGLPCFGSSNRRFALQTISLIDTVRPFFVFCIFLCSIL